MKSAWKAWGNVGQDPHEKLQLYNVYISSFCGYHPVGEGVVVAAIVAVEGADALHLPFFCCSTSDMMAT